MPAARAVEPVAAVVGGAGQRIIFKQCFTGCRYLAPAGAAADYKCPLNMSFQFHFISDTSLISSLAPGRTIRPEGSPLGGRTVCGVRSLSPRFTFELELESGVPVFAQPAEKEHVNKGRDEGQNPREHLCEPCYKEVAPVARLGRGAGFGSELTAGEFDFQRYLGVGAPEPVRQRCHKKEQQ